jgi:hypothetical protein
METYYGTIKNIETLDFRQIEIIEQRCRQQRSSYIFDSIMTFITLPITIAHQIVGKNTKK